MIGLPGNPVSALVCALLFVKPAIERMMGLASAGAPNPRARLAGDLPANDRRQDYLRARLPRAPTARSKPRRSKSRTAR